MANILSLAETRAMLASPPEGLVVLDVRTPEEVAGGTLPDAVVIDIHEPDFPDRVAELDRAVPYLVYCKAGGRSANAAAFMEANGFTDVSDFAGGWMAWADAGLG